MARDGTTWQDHSVHGEGLNRPDSRLCGSLLTEPFHSKHCWSFYAARCSGLRASVTEPHTHTHTHTPMRSYTVSKSSLSVESIAFLTHVEIAMSPNIHVSEGSLSFTTERTAEVRTEWVFAPLRKYMMCGKYQTWCQRFPFLKPVKQLSLLPFVLARA